MEWLLDNWQTVLLLVVSLIALGLYIAYPQQKQSPDAISAWAVALDNGVIIVIYSTTDLERAKQEFSLQYPNYTILETYVDKEHSRTLIKGQPRKEGED